MINLSDLHAENPFTGFDYAEHPLKLEGWNSEEATFERLIEELQPQLIIEVGTWLGASAAHMSDCLLGFGLMRAQIVCVDTWLGALEMWQDQADPTRYGALKLEHGYPTIYRQFLANMCWLGHEETIIPFPQTSLIAARWFAWKGIKADLIYIDASHDFEDVLADLTAWSRLVRPGGVIFGDDYGTFESVRNAVNLYANAHELPLEVQGNKWIIRL